MTAANAIREYIENIPKGTPFPSSALRYFASTDNVRQILNRLVKQGEVKRVARGVFVKPEYQARLGDVLPSATEIAKKLAESTGETIVVQAAEAARLLQLTTQVPMKLVFYTSGNTRTLKIANRSVRLKHVNPSRLIAPGTIEGLVISALIYLGRSNVTLQIIDEIKNRISLEQFNATLKLREHMPAWMSDVFFHYLQGKRDD